MFHFNFCFHFALVNIYSEHSNIPFQSGTLWKVTYDTIHTKN